MIELIVVLSVIVLLTSILLPGLQAAREGARRVMCSANQRQIGVAFMLFGSDENGRLPSPGFRSKTGSRHDGHDDGRAPKTSAHRRLRWARLALERSLHRLTRVLLLPRTQERTHVRGGERQARTRGPVADPAFCNYHYTGHLTHAIRARGSDGG